MSTLTPLLARVLELVQDNPTTAVLPASDQSIASLRPWREKIEAHTCLALASEAALNLAVDKGETIRIATELGIPVPRTVTVESDADLHAALAEVGYPAVVKPGTSWRREIGGQRLIPCDVLNEQEATQLVQEMHAAGVAALVQELAPGRREAVSLFRASGKVVAKFAQAALRTTPVLGGAFVLRESIPMPDDLHAAAMSLVDAIDLDGYSEVEFRRDASGRPLLMEINPRLSGSIELSVRSGVDFPLMLWQWATGRPVVGCDGFRPGVRLRWLTGDVRWLVETVRRPGRPDSVPPRQALSTFIREFARGDSYDLFEVGDPLPALAELWRLVEKFGPFSGEWRKKPTSRP